MAAVDEGHGVGKHELGLEAVRQAIRSGADVNARDGAGWTALMDAALQGLPRITDLLLTSGADVNARSKKGETALLVASGCFIVRKRAEISKQRNLPDSTVTAELDAPRRMVNSLIAHGADANAHDSDGVTPLMNASKMGWSEVVRVLLKAHANINARDIQGRLAIDYVEHDQQPDILGLLRRSGSEAGSGRSGRVACDAQALLIRLHYGLPDIVDCSLGESTQSAIRAFQKDQGLAVTGLLDDSTLREMQVRP